MPPPGCYHTSKSRRDISRFSSSGGWKAGTTDRTVNIAERNDAILPSSTTGGTSGDGWVDRSFPLVPAPPTPMGTGACSLRARPVPFFIPIDLGIIRHAASDTYAYQQHSGLPDVQIGRLYSPCNRRNEKGRRTRLMPLPSSPASSNPCPSLPPQGR